MNNKFTNFIDFVSPDSASQAKNLYHPIGNLRPFTAQIGDFWRLLIKNSILRGTKVEQVEARIVEVSTNCQGVWDGETFSDTDLRATIRKQYCESYTEFTIKINAPSTNSAYRQFALMRANGQRVLGTVKATATTAEDYARQVQAHFESYPYATVVVHRNGTLLKVRVYNNNAFRLNDEAVSVGIGQVSDKNTNVPSITASLTDSISYAARYSYAVSIENVEPGNIFSLNGKSYTAVVGSTVADVKAALLGTAARLTVLQSETVSASATKGARYLINTNAPTLELAYHSASGGNDRYIVTVGASLLPGNAFQIQASGQPTKSFTAIAGSTAATIKAALVEVSGYYEVPTGTAPTWSAVAGTQLISNVNTPSIKLEDQQAIAAVDMDQYRIIVGASVEKGNVYKLGELEYIANGTDTADTVGVALGLTGSIDYVEVGEGAGLSAYVKPGNRYTDEDIADISIVSQPRVKKSGQLVLEVDFSQLLSGKVYSIQLINAVTEEVLGYSNFLHVETKAFGTQILEVADGSDAHGYQYYESGITQRIRLPLHLKMPKQRTSENRSKRIEGGYNRTMTMVEDTQELITQGESPEFHKALALWLKHSKVWIESGGITQEYFHEGEYSESVISEWPPRKQAMANLVLSQEHNNRNYFFTTASKPLGYGDALLRGFAHGLRIILKTNTFDALLKEGSNYLPCAEYQLYIYNDGDARKIRIAPEGYENLTVLLPKQSVAKVRRLVRIESDTTLEILCERTTALTVDYSLEVQTQAASVVSYTAERETLRLASFNDDFGDEFSN